MIDSNKMNYSSTVQVVASLFLVTIATANQSTPTYEWTDETGETLTCKKCPPGTYVEQHCSSKTDTVCKTCPEEHYTQYWNYLDKCRFCNVICQEGEQVKYECNCTHNRVCECQPGYHHSGHYCVKDPQCNVQEDKEEEGDEECDKLVIDFIVSLNISNSTFRKLENSIYNHKGRRPVSQRRVRNLLRDFKDKDPDHPLLPRLFSVLKKANISNLEKKLQKRFLEQENSE
ncbi:tumor necrosis factor receptor superfamily member 6B [Anomaloglossus baeobatrachus]|uniref:tumor necrosis factor receptor superfamily member 6B n=1 Tax=Anomaloglossus baeobatrachus TaxID=238106 RepID=UPI003F50AAF5